MQFHSHCKTVEMARSNKMGESINRTKWSIETANMAGDHAAGKVKVAKDKGLNPVEKEIESEANSVKNAADEEFVNKIEEPRMFTASLSIPSDQVVRIEMEASNGLQSEVIEHDRKHDAMKSEIEEILIRIRAIERSELGRGYEVRSEANRVSLALSVFEFISVTILLTMSGYFQGGLATAILFAGIIPLTTLCAGWLVGDYSLRNVTNSKLSIWQRIMAFVIGIIVVISVLLLINEFAEFRGRLEDAPSYLVLGIKTLGALVFFISIYKWYQAPPANPEQKALKKRLASQQNQIENTFHHHLNAVNQIADQSQNSIDKLISSVEPSISDLYLAVRDVEHANAIYLSQLSETRVSYENEINRHRAQFRDSVPVNCEIPTYFLENVNLNPLFQSCFDLEKFVEDVKMKVSKYEDLKSNVKKIHTSIEQNRINAQEKIYNKYGGAKRHQTQKLSGGHSHAV